MAKNKTKNTVKPAEEIKIYEDIQVELIPIDLIQLNPYNPKKPMSKDRKKGLNRSLSEFGFKGVVLVAPYPDDDDEYIVLDGNTRIEELRRRGIEKVPCLVYRDIVTWEDIKKFTITYDRNVKAFDEDIVMAQLKELAGAGEDMNLLADLANIPNLDNLLVPVEGIVTPVTDNIVFEEQDSLLLTGSKIVIDAIRELAKRIKGKLPLQDKIYKILSEGKAFDWEDDEALTFILLALAHRFGATNKLVIPCVSNDQKQVIIQKVQEFIDSEGIGGDFALSRAIEYDEQYNVMRYLQKKLKGLRFYEL
jgi:hypothetical protein